MKPLHAAFLFTAAAATVAAVAMAPADAHPGEAAVLAYLNAPTLSQKDLTRALGGNVAQAAALFAARPFHSLNEVVGIPGVGAPTVAKLEDWLAVPLPPDDRETLEADPDLQRQLAVSYLRYAVDAHLWKRWHVYPGIPHRLQVEPPIQQGIAAARPLGGKEAREETWGWLDPANDDQRYRSAGTSLFNDAATAYIDSNLFPLETFKEQIIARERTVEFPYDSVVVKFLFLQIPPGLEKDQGRVAGLETPAPVGPNGEVLRPIHTIEHPDFGTMGLVQVDISTKQYNTWTWMTFKYDPDQGDPNAWSLSPQLRDGTVLQTFYSQHYMGPVDNKQSSCIACHQMAQFPRVLDFNAGVAQPDHHQVRDAPYGEELTKRDIPSMFVDYMWEVTQALDWEEQTKGRLTIDDYPLPLSINPPAINVSTPTQPKVVPGGSPAPVTQGPVAQGAGVASVVAATGQTH